MADAIPTSSIELSRIKSPTSQPAYENDSAAGISSAPFPTYFQHLDSSRIRFANYEFSGLRKYLISKKRKSSFAMDLMVTIVDANDAGRIIERSLEPLRQAFFNKDHSSTWRKFDAMLSHLDSDVVTRFVLVRGEYLDTIMIDLLGHRFGIEPLFFWSSICALGLLGQPEDSDPEEYSIPLISVRSRFLRFGITMSRC